MPLRTLFFSALLALSFASTALYGAEEFLRPHDVIAFVGTEDLVVAAAGGAIEMELLTAFPSLHLKFRSLAKEGDTVYEQPRDLNYPGLEAQLDSVGATVVLAQFGQIESFQDGQAGLSKFSEAYRALCERLSDGGKRRMILLAPTSYEASQMPEGIPTSAVEEREKVRKQYEDAIKKIATDSGPERRFIAGPSPLPAIPKGADGASSSVPLTRDGIHLSKVGQHKLAKGIRANLAPWNPHPMWNNAELAKLTALVKEKDALWFNYYRPQNWAFLAGDRISQPSSHDYLDTSKRWFPDEMKRFLPLIAEKEAEIDALLLHSPYPAK